MKKILVVLLVLAAATGVFAQDGEWSLSGNVEIGALVDLTGDDVFIYGQTYNLPYNGWGPIHGVLDVGYQRDQLSLGLGFHSSENNFLRGNVQYDGGNYALQWQSNLLTFFKEDDTNHQRLWGYYKLLNEMVKLEVAVTSPDQEYWVSDKTGAFVRHLLTLPNIPGGHASTKWTKGFALNDQPWATNKTYAWVDRDDYLLANVNLSNLEFGVMLPHVFGWGDNQDGINGNDQGAAINLLEGVMKNTLVGFKFTMQPVEVAAQFQFGTYGVYFGGKWFIGPVTAGLSFSGILKPDDPIKKIRFGGGIEYNPGVFGAWINGFYALDGSTNDRNTQIGIEPGFFYNVIPSHLQFRTNVGFYFSGGKVNADTKKDLEVGWAVQPELFWNFLGTGAGSYWAYGTGMIVRYRLLADGSAWGATVPGSGRMGKTNALDVNFKFSF